MLGISPATVTLIKQKASGVSNVSHSVSSAPKISQRGDLSTATEQELKVFEFLKGGYPYSYIEKSLDLKHSDFILLIKSLKKQKIIFQEDINNYRNIRKLDDKDFVIQNLSQGISQRGIVKMRPWLNIATVSRMVTELKNEGIMSDTQIVNAKLNSPHGYNHQEKFVLSLLRKGYDDIRIARCDKSGYLTPPMVRKIRKNLVEKGRISSERISALRKKKVSEDNVKELKKLKTDVYKLVTLGMTVEDISVKLDCSNKRTKSLISALIKEGKLDKNQIKLRETEIKKETLKAQKIRNRVELLIQKFDKNGKLCKSDEQTFINSCCSILDNGDVLNDAELHVLNDIVLYGNKFNSSGLKLLLTAYLKLNMFDDAMIAVNSCIRIFGSNASLQDLRFKVRKLQQGNDALKLIKSNAPMQQIIHETGLTEVEIIGIKKHHGYNLKKECSCFEKV